MTSNMAQKSAIQTRVVFWLQSQKKLKIGTFQKFQIQLETIQIFNLEQSAITTYFLPVKYNIVLKMMLMLNIS